MTSPAYVRLRNRLDPLPSPEREYIRITVSQDDANVEPVAFAVHKRIARQCKLFDAILDELDLADDSSTEGTATIPDVDPEACAAALKYLELASIRIPTMLVRPLRAPLSEIVQPWEMRFLTENCLEQGDERRHSNLLNVMKVSDFLIVDSLRDLCCAFLASIVLQCNSEAELLSLLGLPRAPSAEELAPLYDQFPFLR